MTDPATASVMVEAAKQAPAIGVIAYLVVRFLRELRAQAEEHRSHVADLTSRHERSLIDLLNRYDATHERVMRQLAQIPSCAAHRPPGTPPDFI